MADSLDYKDLLDSGEYEEAAAKVHSKARDQQTYFFINQTSHEKKENIDLEILSRSHTKFSELTL